MIKAVRFFEGFCQTAAMTSALTAFFLVCFEENSIFRAVLVAICGIISTAFWYLLALYAGRIIARHGQVPGNAFANDAIPD